MFKIKRERYVLGCIEPKLEKIDDLVYQFKLDILQTLKERKNALPITIKTEVGF